MSHGLEVRDLLVELADGTPVVQGVSFDVRPGEIVALVGESGCGKTTIGTALLGHARRGARIAGGSVRLDGVDLLALKPDEISRLRGARIAYVPQDPASALSPGRRIGWQLRDVLREHAAGLSAQQRSEAVASALTDVRLPSDAGFLARFPHQLSGGQLQRVLLAMAFLLRPAAIVLDEPTTSLDVTTQARILEIVREQCRSRKVAAVHVTHDLAVVRHLADRVLVLYGGRIAEVGTRQAVFEAPAHPYTGALLSAVPDVAGRRTLGRLPGTAPSPADRPAGCPFSPRCRRATERCAGEQPPVIPIGPAHQVACWEPVEPVRGAHAAQLAHSSPVEDAKAANASPALLEVRGLSAHYGSVQALFDVDLEVRQGECLALVGESGSGKSTLSRSLVGLNGQWTGMVCYAGKELARQAHERDPEIQRTIQYVFQSPDRALNPRRTVIASIMAPVRHFFGVSDEEAREQAREALSLVSLSPGLAERLPRDLSGGERQRAAIARAVACRPTLMICDEITSALDVSVQASILELLGRLQSEQQLTMLFVTHNLAVVRQLADRVAVLHNGRVAEVGPVHGVLDHATDPYTLTLIRDSLSLADIQDIARGGPDVPVESSSLKEPR
ncbi:ABC transporter ATP-binding protein [Streptomyces sp. NPDC091280]|uniref:ABC transporter ATP-binding protein n=1 Tax=Streptomyces sp. NPDC091280 TaxID=3365984 RepID=UPI00381EB116